MTDRDTISRCFRCREPLDPRADHATIELNPNGGGEMGFHHAKVCEECETELAEQMRQTTGGNI